MERPEPVSIARNCFRWWRSSDEIVEVGSSSMHACAVRQTDTRAPAVYTDPQLAIYRHACSPAGACMDTAETAVDCGAAIVHSSEIYCRLTGRTVASTGPPACVPLLSRRHTQLHSHSVSAVRRRRCYSRPIIRTSNARRRSLADRR